MEKRSADLASGLSSEEMTAAAKDDKDEKVPVTEETEEDDSEFIWDEYLEETSSIAAAPTSFLHVEKSLQSCFTSGMKLEVPTKDNPDAFWIATVILTCGPLLRLRYEGFGDDRTSGFWYDITSKDIHPIGWCAENNMKLIPPSEIKDKIGNWDEFLSNALKDAKTVPQYLLEANCTTPVDLIKQGMKLEILQKLNPTHIWIATVLENVGGRLLLRYEGASSAEDFWLFYLSYRVHPVGWSKENNHTYTAPESVVSKCGKERCMEILQAAIAEASKMPLLHDIFENQEKIKPHKFKTGMKLEAVHPGTLVQFHPATIVEVFNDYYFSVQIDDHSLVDQQRHAVCCHAESPYILPMGWAASKGIKVMHPRGWMNYRQEFDSAEYLKYCKAEAAPKELFTHQVSDHGFEVSMKLEAINPFQPNQICAATITKICDNFLWIQLDSIDSFNPNHIVPVTSHDIFPVGWCESNRYPLKPPLNVQQSRGRLMKKVAIFIQEKQRKPGKSDVACDVKAWCPKIFFNHRCFSGPYLSKGRIAELPRDVGPGPVTLVLKEVLSKLINVAYKSSKVLQELQLKGKPNPNMQQCTLKAKYKGKCYRSVVEVLRNSEHIEDFCHQICKKLECCPYLFGPRYVGETCPEQCFNLTKTKYTCSNAKKKRKVVPPPLNPDGSVKVPGKRGRKRKNPIADDKSSNNNEKNSGNLKQETHIQKDCKIKDPALAKITPVSESTTGDKPKEGKQQKRKYVRYVPPKSEIVTRGAKLPNFALGFQCWRRKKSERSERKTKQRASREFLASTPSPASRDSSEDNSKTASETPSEINTDSMEDKDSTTQETNSITSEPLLESNPLYWSVEDVIQYMKDTDCAQMARLFKEQDIDGQALLLLTLPIVQEHLELKLDPAVKLCKQVERIKFAFFSQFAK